MTTHRSDTHLFRAVTFAEKHKPCVVACRTVAGMDAARSHLESRGKVSSVRVSTRGAERAQQLKDFADGTSDYLVIASQLLYTGGVWFTREGCSIASADALTKDRAAMLATRLRSPTADVATAVHVFAPIRESSARNRSLSWDTHSVRGTGRTTRMLEYAATVERQTVVVALNLEQAEKLCAQYIDIAGTKPDPKFVHFLTFSDLAGYDWTTGRVEGQPIDCEILIDHFVMETHLANVLHYLKSVQHVGHVPSWLANTAMALTSLGRKVYVIADDDRGEEVRLHLKDYPNRISIEDGSMMGSLNWLDLTLHRAHPNCQLLFDPRILRTRFKASLDLVNRWDA